MMAARLDTLKDFTVTAPQPLFQTDLTSTQNNHPYVVTKDGQRFLIPVHQSVDCLTNDRGAELAGGRAEVSARTTGASSSSCLAPSGDTYGGIGPVGAMPASSVAWCSTRAGPQASRKSSSGMNSERSVFSARPVVLDTRIEQRTARPRSDAPGPGRQPRQLELAHVSNGGAFTHARDHPGCDRRGEASRSDTDREGDRRIPRHI